MRRVSSGAARRYARALLELAVEQADPGRIREQLDALAAALESHRELAAALQHPALGAEKKQALLQGVFKDVAPLLARLLALLAQRNRLPLLPGIARAYATLWNAQRGVAEAELVSAAELEPTQRGAIAEALAAATGKRIELSPRIDPEILGGVLVKVDGRVYDGSVRGRLRALRQHLAGEGSQ
jgi:F-type H+-transporting ATPase subunit delta